MSTTSYRPPRFYQIRAVRSRSYMASYMAMVREAADPDTPATCFIYSLFTNLDDADISSPEKDETPTLRQQLFLDGEVSLPVPVPRLEEPDFLVNTIKKLHDKGEKIRIRRIRP